MFLKKIKIDGFKSFAKPVTLKFDTPMSAIVGPNGSGKSNIVDAVRWAMGEQSARTLRGSTMADVIFAGSKDHKALKKASVTLFFDNSNQELMVDDDEVRISRCVFEDGQSDYRINGSSCRLKDIEELLMDTGMGKDSYSIVGQGRIDYILNSRAEKRRELFEEAAGISKYKMRKENSEKRLERTKTDLQRVNDLIWELDKQVKPLKKAAEKTRKYQRIYSELKTLEVSLLLDKWKKNKTELDELLEEDYIFHKDLKSLNNTVEFLKKKLAEKRIKMEEEINNLEKLQEDFYNTRLKKEQTINNLKILREKRNSMYRERDNLKKEYNIIEDKIKKLQINIKKIKEQLSKVDKKQQSLKKEMAVKEKDLSKEKDILDKSKSKLLNLRNTFIDGNTELSDLRQELEKYREKKRYLKKELENISYKQEKVQLELEEKIENIGDLKRKLNEINQEIEKLNQKQKKLCDNRKEQEKKINKKEEMCKIINKELQQVESRLDVLKEMEEEYQGYFQGVRSVLKAKDNLSGIIGVVADEINVEKKYELAIETALGARLQNIIVEKEKDARKAVKFLKKEKAGRATFLPVDMVNARKVKLNKFKMKNDSHLLGIASDFVENNEKTNEIINYLLGKVLITEDLKSAVSISKKINNSLKIVTLDGDVVNPGGAISGGSKKKSRGLLSRSRQIEELQEKKEKIHSRYQKKGNELIQLKGDLEKIENNLVEVKSKIDNKRFDKNNLQKDINNSHDEQKKLKREVDKLKTNIIDCRQQIENNKKLQEEYKKKIEMVNNQHDQGKNKLGELEKNVIKKEETIDVIKNEITDFRISLAKIEEKQNNYKEERENLSHQLISSKKDKERYQQQIININEKFENMDEREKELEDLKKKFIKKVENLQKSKVNKKTFVEKMEVEVEELEEKFIKEQHKSEKVREDYHKLELKKTRLEDKNERIENRLKEEYEVEPGENNEECIEIDNYSRVSSKVKEFKDSLRKLQPVNHGAVEEFKELKTRLEYLREQHNDLLTARDSILELIEELEDKMSSLFYQTFAEVKEAFEAIFVKLFEGGMAELTLTKPENLLETGVEIEAQPPGKQLKKISLMSGGERALTAIALVFAFMHANPSPVYILDEIDAPLDDANVNRFSDFLKKYSQYVQFMVVTHNKLMMTQADTIYGITMEEAGISKMILLEFDEEIA